MEEISELITNIEILDKYTSAYGKIRCRCKRCGYEWTTNARNLLYLTDCPKCLGHVKKTQEEFIQELAQVHPDIEVIGKDMKTNLRIKVKCKRCVHIWEAVPYNLLNGSGCPKCNITKGEKRVAQYLDNLGIEYIYNMGYFNDLVSVNGGLMRPDFIIPSLKIWIEYDGQQ